MSQATTFEQAYSNLIASTETLSRMMVGKNVELCNEYYDVASDTILTNQVQLVSDAVWTHPHLACSSILESLFRPYIQSASTIKPTTKLIDHPNIMRSCLAIANFIDDEAITMEVEHLNLVTSFLMSLPDFPSEHDRLSPLLPRVGHALLGEQWLSICAIYDLPLEGTSEFRKAIWELPSSILKQPMTFDAVVVPQNIAL